MYFVKSSILLVILCAFLSTSQFVYSQDQADGYLPFAEQMPQPIGGLGAIYKNITYPDAAKQAGIQGKVYVLIYINENGGVDDVKIVKGLGAGCDQAAIKGIKEEKFTPAKNGSNVVKVKLSMAIEFKLTG